MKDTGPAGVWKLLSRAFSLFAFRPGVMIAAACVTAIPMIALSGFLYAAGDTWWGVLASIPSFNRGYVVQAFFYFFSALMYVFLQPLTSAALAILSQKNSQGERGSLRSAIRLYGRSITLWLCNLPFSAGVSILIFVVTFRIIVPTIIEVLFWVSEHQSFSSLHTFLSDLTTHVQLYGVVGIISFLRLLIEVVVDVVMPLSFIVAINEGKWGFPAVTRTFNLIGKRFWKLYCACFALLGAWELATIACTSVVYAWTNKLSSISLPQLALSCVEMTLIIPLTFALACAIYHDIRENDELRQRSDSKLSEPTLLTAHEPATETDEPKELNP